MNGLSVQYRRVVFPLSGFFGVSIGKKTNILLNIKDERGEDMTGVKVTYSTIEFQTTSLNSLYELYVAPTSTVSVTINKEGYNSQTFNVTGSNSFQVIEKTMILSIIPYSVIIKK